MGDLNVFDFSQPGALATEDLVVRTTEVDGERSVDVLVTAAGRRALWAWHGFDSAEEARTWLLSTE